MPEPGAVARCPKCGELVPVTPDWRLVICPKCGEVLSRMATDATYD